MTPRSKKPKPSFDVARAPLDSGAAGWVYRSGPSPDTATPESESIEIVPVSTAARLADAPPPAAPAAPAAKTARSRGASAEAAANRTTGQRIESGIDLLLTPFTLPLMILFVKMRWIIGPRSGR